MEDLVIIQRIFSGYRKGVFNELYKKISFTLLHSKNKSGIKQVKAVYSKTIRGLRFTRKETGVFLNVLPYIVKHKPKVIIHEFSVGVISLLPTLIVAKLIDSKFILWGHGYDRTKGFRPEKKFLDRFRVFLMKKSDAIILYSKQPKILLSGYINKEKIFIAYNALNTIVLNKIRDDLEKEGIRKVKARINFHFKYNLIFIGRLTKEKQPEILVDIFDYLRGAFKDTLCVHYVGVGEQLNSIVELVNSKGFQKNFVFHGGVYDDRTNGEMLFCSDLLVLPGKVGLSLNHAFNFNCPVITFKQTEKGPFHSPEIEYLVDGETGFLIENQDVSQMAKTISEYLRNKDLQEMMKKNVKNMVINECSVEYFVKGFLDAINYVLKEHNDGIS